MKTVKLNNGVKMPILGLGVFQMNQVEAEESVYEAILAGYRLIDTAVSYGNEEAVGKAIKKSGVPREELFITSKVWVKDVNYEGTFRAYQKSLDKLQLDYIDLYLIHQPYNDIFGSWRALEELYEQKKVRAIGVSNFTSARITDFVINNKITPIVNQIETHPFNQQTEAHKVLNEYNIQHEGWAPFAEGQNNIFANKVLVDIAKKHSKSIAQVIIRWNIQREIVVIPKSTHIERIKENFNVFDFELSSEDMDSIMTLDENKGLFVNREDPEYVRYLYARDYGKN